MEPRRFDHNNIIYLRYVLHRGIYTVVRRASVSGKNPRNMVAHLLGRRRTRAMRLQQHIIIIILFKNT